jgi:hypothetical protein
MKRYKIFKVSYKDLKKKMNFKLLIKKVKFLWNVIFNFNLN